jgi:HSP20 family molecular chaperone IbpA/ABC-type cobalamin/Fe3+-siderophores transport system ATPase subunit
MAVFNILHELTLRNNDPTNKNLWDKYKKKVDLYDIVIGMNSLEDLESQGWEIQLGKHVDSIEPTTQTIEGLTVAVIGAYNRGKTFLLNKLCNIQLPHGNLVHTNGISITSGRKGYTDIVFMDTAGTDTPVKREKLPYKRATEAFLRELVVYLCSVIIIVVNRLRSTDQVYIDKVLEHCKSQDKMKNIIIVHNLFDVETVAGVEEIINEEVQGLFDASKREKQFRVKGQLVTVNCYSSKLNDFHLNHFILARDNSAAAKIWNLQTLDGIMNLLQAPLEPRGSLNVISEIFTFSNAKLPQLFEKDHSETHDNGVLLQVAQHNSLPFIVLSTRKELPNLKDNPHSLKLSEKLVYDDAGYFIKNVRGFWEPRHNVYEVGDQIRLVLDLAGLKEGETSLAKTENRLTFSGNRDDLRSNDNECIHVSQIPTGKFHLAVGFKQPIDLTTLVVKRDEGFLRVDVKKKNLDPDIQAI